MMVHSLIHINPDWYHPRPTVQLTSPLDLGAISGPPNFLMKGKGKGQGHTILAAQHAQNMFM